MATIATSTRAPAATTATSTRAPAAHRLAFFRGLALALAISLLLWAAIFLAAWRLRLWLG